MGHIHFCFYMNICPFCLAAAVFFCVCAAILPLHFGQNYIQSDNFPKQIPNKSVSHSFILYVI